MKRKPRYSFLLLFLFLFLSLPLHSLAKYFYLQLYDHYLVSKKFYFESDFLSLEGKNYTLENYGGTGDYIFSLNLFNYLNLEDYSEEDISYDMDKLVLMKNNTPIELTALELKLVNLLFVNINKVVSRNVILDKIWDWTGNYVDDHTVTVYFKRIREKIGTNIITTIK